MKLREPVSDPPPERQRSPMSKVVSDLFTVSSASQRMPA